MLGLAGCGSSGDTTGTPTPGSSSAFRAVSVDGTDLVVELHDEANVSEVTLINPDGSLYGQREIATGVTTVRFKLVELELGRAEHYTPGEYELIADSGGQSQSQAIELRPEIRIQEIRQYTADDLPAANTRIAVTVENVGTAPTWIYDIVYRNAPNPTANDKLGSRSGVPHLSKPEQIDQLLLQPGGTQTYVGSNQPLRFSKQDGRVCDAVAKMTVILGNAAGDPLRQRIRVTADGNPSSPDARERYLCSDVSLKRLNSTATPTVDDLVDT